MLLTRNSRQRTYGVEICADGSLRECDGIICAHCGCEETESTNPDILGCQCTCCGALICSRCVGKGCMPLEERLDAWERYNSGLKYLRKDRLFEIFGSNGKVLK